MTAIQKVCRCALQRGDLIMRRRPNGIPDWKFGRRIFSEHTVAKLIARGEAVREGNVVRMA